MPTRILICACALLTTLALAVPAAAKLPAPASKLIEPGTSVGGVTLGKKVAKAKAAWGKGGACSGSEDGKNGTCSYGSTPKAGSASFGYVEGKVVDMFLSLGRNKAGKVVFRTSLANFETAKGIGLGSTRKAVKQAYPKAKSSNGFDTVLTLKGKGKRYTTFSFENDRVTQISIGDGAHQG
jgi:hypothetical protein